MEQAPPPAEEDIEKKISKTLSYSVLDGMFWAIMAGFGEYFFVPFAVFLGANNIILGLINTFPQFAGSLAQMVSIKLLKRFPSRRIFVCSGAALQAATFLFLGSLYFVKNRIILLLMIGVFFYWVFGMMGGPAWSSWMGDLLENRKGKARYLGKRSMAVGFTLFSAFMVAGSLLHNFAENNQQLLGFLIIFLIAFAGRSVSAFFLSKKYEPKLSSEPASEFSFISFIKQMKHRRFGLLSLYLALMGFAVALAGPFFAPYMLRDLNFSYMTYTLLISTALIFKYLFMPLWGKYTDRFGSKKVLTVCGWILPLVPFLWLVSRSPYYLIFAEALSGIAWAGYEISSFSLMLESTSSQKRVRCFAFHNTLSAFFVLVGSFIGGLIVRYNSVFWSKYLFVFLLSGVLRYIISLSMLFKLQEVRQVEEVTYKEFIFKILTLETVKDIRAAPMFLYNKVFVKKSEKVEEKEDGKNKPA